MRIIAVDDEPLALAGLLRALREVVPQAETAGFGRAQEAFAFLRENAADVAVLDIEMAGMSGMELAARCKHLCPRINIIFVTGHSEYALDAIRLHASGYLLKPVRAEDLRQELDTLRHPVAPDKPRVQTFGSFEVYWMGAPLSFPRTKCKECLAYLVDRRGAQATTRELAGVLWPDRPYDRAVLASASKVVSELKKTLRAACLQDILIKKFNSLRLDETRVDCDYYGFLAGEPSCLGAFTGEYMRQYPWAQATLESLRAQGGG